MPSAACPAAAAIDGTILTLGTIWVVFFAQSFLGPFQSFLITLGVPIAAWAGILMADVMLRRRNYDEAALFDACGRYGDWNWTAIVIMVVGALVGWGLVINVFADVASWNNWQGYLLGPLGLGGKEGTWAWANTGVLVSLAIGFLGWLALGRSIVRRQEEGLTPAADARPDRVVTS